MLPSPRVVKETKIQPSLARTNGKEAVVGDGPTSTSTVERLFNFWGSETERLPSGVAARSPENIRAATAIIPRDLGMSVTGSRGTISGNLATPRGAGNPQNTVDDQDKKFDPPYVGFSEDHDRKKGRTLADSALWEGAT